MPTITFSSRTSASANSRLASVSVLWTGRLRHRQDTASGAFPRRSSTNSLATQSWSPASTMCSARSVHRPFQRTERICAALTLLNLKHQQCLNFISLQHDKTFGTYTPPRHHILPQWTHIHHGKGGASPLAPTGRQHQHSLSSWRVLLVGFSAH